MKTILLVLNSSSEFKGVHKHRDKWKAQITRDGKRHYLGVFTCELEAAKAVDKAAIAIHGQYAWLNLPQAINAVVASTAREQ